MQVFNDCHIGINTNFKMLAPKYAGLYKKHPEYATKLYDAFKQNEKAVKFCEDFNGRVVFYAFKSGYNLIESSVNIFYDNPAMSKIKKLWKAINSSEPCVKVLGWGRDFYKGESTQDLIKKVLPDNNGNGLLSSSIDYARNQIVEDLQHKTVLKKDKNGLSTAMRKLTELSE